MKKTKMIYRIITGLFSALVLMGASQYFFNYEVVSEMFTNLNFPTYLIYPMGIAKLLGVLAFWINVPKRLKEWAYAGFMFNFLLAISAHINVNDGEFFPAVIALIFAIASYFFYRKLEVKDELQLKGV